MRFWHIYTWTVSVALVLSAAGRIILFFKKRESVSRVDLIEAFAGVMAIPALFDYAYGRAYGFRAGWQALFLVLCVLSIYQLFSPKTKQIYRKSVALAVAAIAAQCVIGGPALWELFAYAFLHRSLAS